MALMVWDESYSVGFELIDEQHKRLIDLINMANDAITNDRGREIMGHVLDELIDYVRTHFATEERLMRENAYPLTDSHMRMHQDLLRNAVMARGQFSVGQHDVSAPVAQFLRDWLANHIQRSDKTLGSFLASCRLATPLAAAND